MLPRSVYFVAVAVAALAIFVGLKTQDVSAQTGVTTATATATATATSTATATATATPAQTPAACPTGATIAVAAPTSAAPTTVSVTVTPALNLKPGTAGDLTSYHLHYFIDTPATAAGTAVPTGDPKIIHSATTTQDLGALTAGSHTVAVVLGQLSHVACETRGTVTFTVAGAPTAPKTGSAGLVSDDAAPLAAFALLGIAIALTAGGRLATRRTK